MEIGVIGAGSWGTSLANLLALKGHTVKLWVYEEDLAARMAASGENDLYLPGIQLSANLKVTCDLDYVAAQQCLVLVPPSQLMRTVIGAASASIKADSRIIAASKGIENDTLMTMSELLRQLLPTTLHRGLAFLSGPTFAREIAMRQPAAAVVAADDDETATFFQQLFNTDYFRVYTNNDVIGIEIGGALKNVIALAAGICDGLGFGYNTRAALITRGLAEIRKIGLAMGARPETFSGLAGMGDLVLTCTGDLSRNRSVGIELGKGRKLDEIIAEMSMVAEGVKTTISSYQLAQKLGVEAPIIEQMYAILYQNKAPEQAVVELMQRDLKSEYH